MCNTQEKLFKPGDRVSVSIIQRGNLFHVCGVILEVLEFAGDGHKQPVYSVRLDHRPGHSRIKSIRHNMLMPIKKNSFKVGDRVFVGQETNGHWYGTVESLGEGYRGEHTYNILFENGTFAGETREFAEKFISLAEEKESCKETLYLFVNKFNGQWFYGNVVFTTETSILVRKDNGEETLVVKDQFQLFQKVSL